MFKHLCKTLFQRPMSIIPNYKPCKTINSCKSTLTQNVEAERIVWMDLEMTGLDSNTDKIMEVACIVTDGKLNIIAEGPDIIIKQPDNILNNMDPWCIKQHGKTGLTEASKNSKISLEEAEKIVLNFLHEHIQPGISPLGGSSVYYDRAFLKKYMPKVESYLHYRIIDVSTVKELCRRWNSEVYTSAPKKEYLHRSLTDIKESINELRWYRENFMKLL